MAEGQDPDKITANDAVKIAKGAEGVARIAAGDIDPTSIKDAAQAIEPVAKAGKRALKSYIGCCAGIVFAGLFIFSLITSRIAGPGLSSANANTTSYGGTGGGDLANADALTLEQIKDLLKSEGRRGKNMLPYAQQIYNSAHSFHINPLLSIAMFVHESSLGTAGAGETCRNPGNISHRSDDYKKSGITGKGNCENVWGGNPRWEGFATYGDGAQAQMWLLRVYMDSGVDTLAKIIHKYAPSADGNNESAYVKFVTNYMNDHAGGN